MKIIKQGKRPEDFWPYDSNHTCGTCGCVFRLEPEDQITMPQHGNYVRVPCPNEACNANVLISKPSPSGGYWDDR